LELREVIADYEILARQGIKLNKSYLEMLNICNELNLNSDISVEEKDAIFKVIYSMQHDQNTTIEKILELYKYIQIKVVNVPDRIIVNQFQLIAQDCLTISSFIESIDLLELQQNFKNLIY
jgi:hypothetical protein